MRFSPILKLLCSDFGPKTLLGWCLASRQRAASSPCLQQVHFGKVGKPDLMFSPHLSQLKSCQALPRRKESVPKLQFFRPTGNKQQQLKKKKWLQKYHRGLEWVGSCSSAGRAAQVSSVNTRGWLCPSLPARRGSFLTCCTCRPCSAPLKTPKSGECTKTSAAGASDSLGFPARRGWAWLEALQRE